MADAVRRVKGELLRSVLDGCALGKQVADPVGYDLVRAAIVGADVAILAPPGEVGDAAVIAEANTRLVEDHPSTGAVAKAIMERAAEDDAKPRRRLEVWRTRPRAHPDRATDHLTGVALGHVQERFPQIIEGSTWARDGSHG